MRIAFVCYLIICFALMFFGLALTKVLTTKVQHPAQKEQTSR